MRVIALNGYARTGKDAAAEALISIGFQRLAFADKLREFLLTLDPIVGDNAVGIPVRLSDIIDLYGWEGYKNSPWKDEIRVLLQRLGTDCGRRLIDENIWVDSTLKNLSPDGNYVVTDCRFPNEAQGVRKLGGKIIRINRPGVGPINDHISEVALDDYDFDKVVENSGTLEQFQNTIRRVVICA